MLLAGSGSRLGMGAVATVGELLEGHVGLDVECMDRIYLNGCVPHLQVGGRWCRS